MNYLLMNKRNLRSKITKKLTQLSELLDKVDGVRIIEADNSETWDSDTLSKLIGHAKKILELLEDKKDPKIKDPWGEPLVLEEGLCSLVYEYQNEEEESNSDDE